MSIALSQHKIKKTKQLLEEYENSHPANTAAIITDTLTGRADQSLEDISSLLESELTAEASNTSVKTPESRYYLREWKILCDYLAQLPVSHTDLRKYHSSYTPDTTDAANTRILATGTL